MEEVTSFWRCGICGQGFTDEYLKRENKNEESDGLHISN
jgi:hypothetical protein